MSNNIPDARDAIRASLAAHNATFSAGLSAQSDAFNAALNHLMRSREAAGISAMFEPSVLEPSVSAPMPFMPYTPAEIPVDPAQPSYVSSEGTGPAFTFSGARAFPNAATTGEVSPIVRDPATDAAYEGVLFKPKKVTEAAKLQLKVNEAVRGVMLNELQLSRAGIKAEIRTEIDGMIREARDQITKGAIEKAVDEAIKRLNIEHMIAGAIGAFVERRVDAAGGNRIPELRGKVDAEVARQVQAKVAEWLSANVQLSLKGKSSVNEGVRRLVSD